MNTTELRNKIAALLQQSPFSGLDADIKLLLQNQLSSLLTKANLVTREEFDIQRHALTRAQEKLNELEEKIKQLS